MAAPLYKDLAMPKQCSGHYGLWFERFFNQYSPHNWEFADSTEKSKWLKEFHHKTVGDKDELNEHAQAQMQLSQALTGKALSFKAQGHFVTGMGNPHPVENGFAWHPTLGVPYLTGAAVKGLVRAYLERHLEANEDEKKALLLAWFGSTSKEPRDDGYKSQAGAVIFFDAAPTQPVTLGVDIMTPHMGKWYAEGAKNPNQAETVPADWHDPTPIPFLVAHDIELLFSFALRSAAPEAKDIQLSDVAYVLEQALLYAGAGAKTATGYGQMKSLEAIEKAKQQEALQGAEVVEAYLKQNSRNKSLYLEYQRKPIATLTSKEKIEALLNTLDIASQQKINKGEGVKLQAYVLNKEILGIKS